MSNPGNLYHVMEFKTLYSDLFKSDNIHPNNHTTTFAYLLLKIVPDLNKKTANKHVGVFGHCYYWVKHVTRNLFI